MNNEAETDILTDSGNEQDRLPDLQPDWQLDQKLDQLRDLLIEMNMNLEKMNQRFEEVLEADTAMRERFTEFLERNSPADRKKVTLPWDDLWMGEEEDPFEQQWDKPEYRQALQNRPDIEESETREIEKREAAVQKTQPAARRKGR